MLCPRCGKEIPKGSTVCPACGTAPAAAKGQTSPKPVMEKKKREARAASKPRREKTEEEKALRQRIWFILTFAGLALMAAAALMLMLLSGRSRKPEESQPVSLPEASIGLINYYAPAKEDAVRTEGAVSFVGDELLLVSQSGASYIEMERFCSQQELKIVGHVELCGLYQVRLEREYSLNELRQLAARLEKESMVELAAPNVVWLPEYNAMPNDPWGGQIQWEEAFSGADNWGVVAIGAAKCWEIYEPSPVRVGVIDSAFDSHQEDMDYAELRHNPDADALSRPETGAHGTQTASIIGAIHDNAIGLSGVAENCKVYACAVPGRCSIMNLASDIAALTAQDVRAVNLGMAYPAEVVAAALEEDADVLDAYYARTAALLEKSLGRLLEKGYDFLLIQSAGNGIEGQGVDARWNSALCYAQSEQIRSRILVVAAAGVDRNGQFYAAPFSNLGERVDLYAPGVEIYCAVPGGYSRVSGSSAAAAHVSGVCASILAAKPEMSCVQVRDLVKSTANIPVGEDGPGMVNMKAALEAAGAIPIRQSAPSQEGQG